MPINIIEIGPLNGDRTFLKYIQIINSKGTESKEGGIKINPNNFEKYKHVINNIDLFIFLQIYYSRSLLSGEILPQCKLPRTITFWSISCEVDLINISLMSPLLERT